MSRRPPAAALPRRGPPHAGRTGTEPRESLQRKAGPRAGAAGAACSERARSSGRCAARIGRGCRRDCMPAPGPVRPRAPVRQGVGRKGDQGDSRRRTLYLYGIRINLYGIRKNLYGIRINLFAVGGKGDQGDSRRRALAADCLAPPPYPPLHLSSSSGSAPSPAPPAPSFLVPDRSDSIIRVSRGRPPPPAAARNRGGRRSSAPSAGPRGARRRGLNPPRAARTAHRPRPCAAKQRASQQGRVSEQVLKPLDPQLSSGAAADAPKRGLGAETRRTAPERRRGWELARRACATHSASKTGRGGARGAGLPAACAVGGTAAAARSGRGAGPPRRLPAARNRKCNYRRTGRRRLHTRGQWAA